MTDTDLPQRPTVIEWLAAAAAAADFDTLTDAQLVEVDQLATQIQSAVMQVQVRRRVDAAMGLTSTPVSVTEVLNGDTTTEPKTPASESTTEVMPAVVQGELS